MHVICPFVCIYIYIYIYIYIHTHTHTYSRSNIESVRYTTNQLLFDTISNSTSFLVQ